MSGPAAHLRRRGAQARRTPPRGFTLIEVLVALAIVVLGMSAVLAALGQSAADTAYLRDKTFAQWIALDQVAQVRLNTQLPSKGTSDGELDYAGRHWRWSQEVTDLGFPGMLRVDVKVQQADTPAGHDAPWMGLAVGVLGDALARQMQTSPYEEYQPGGGPGGLNNSSSSSASSGSGTSLGPNRSLTPTPTGPTLGGNP